MIYQTKGNLTSGKVSHYVHGSFDFDIPRCWFQGEGQCKKQTFEDQYHYLLQAHLDRWDTDKHPNENSSEGR